MEKWSQSLQRRLSKLESKIESLLVMELEPEKNAPQVPFEPCHDLKQIQTLSREVPENFEDRTIIIFSRLSMYFEIGILFEKERSTWKAQAVFENGRLRGLTNEGLTIKGGPEISALQIVKAPALPFLKQLRIDAKLSKPEDLTAFLIRPHDSVSFVVMTRLPEPWLKMHMDEIHQQVLKAFA
jgi:hypothetical protein